MPKRSNQFQRLVLLINSCLAGNAQVIESAMLKDKVSGESREVDVLISTNVSGYKVDIAIEVVARKRKADATWVESMYAKHSHLPTDKLILVSEKGFYTPALEKAKFYGIEAVTIESALAADWEIAIELTTTGIFELTNFKYKCAVIYEFSDGSRQQVDVPSSLCITKESKQTTLDELVQQVLGLQEIKDVIYPLIVSMNEHQFWFSYSIPGGLWNTEIEGEKAVAIELRVGLDVEHAKTPVEFSTGKYKDALFISGVSLPNSSELLFVLLKKSDGTSEGAIVNEYGVRKLIAEHGRTKNT